MDKRYPHKHHHIHTDQASNNREPVTTGRSRSIMEASSITTPYRRVLQNFFLIWLDLNYDKYNSDFRNSYNRLHSLILALELFTNAEECISRMKDVKNQKILLIISGSAGEHVVPITHHITQLDAIFIFCQNKRRHEAWASKYSKVQRVSTSIEPICKSIKEIIRQCDHDAMPISFVPKRTDPEFTRTSDNKTIDQFEASYMCTVLFRDTIVEIHEDDNRLLYDFLIYCRSHDVPDWQLEDLRKDYHLKKPIWWFTSGTFLYPMLSRALKEFDIEVLLKMRFFIRSLHWQLVRLYQTSGRRFPEKFVAYRGQALSPEDFQHLLQTNGGLLAFNSFSSASLERQTAMEFIHNNLVRHEENIGVLCMITIDQSKISSSTNPFALIDEYSAAQAEKEILFSLSTMFRVVDITQSKTDNRLWEMKMNIVDNSDPQLSEINKVLKKVTGNFTGWSKMGHLLLKLKELEKAELLYKQLISDAQHSDDRASSYYQLGNIKRKQKQYDEALRCYEKCLEIARRTGKEDDNSLLPLYESIGQVFDVMNIYERALEYYGKVKVIMERTYPPDHPELATLYYRIGLAHSGRRDHTRAVAYFEKALFVWTKCLPPTHHLIKTVQQNINDEKRKYKV